MQLHQMIPLVSLFVYAYLLCIMTAAKKDRIIRSFITILIFAILWSGGSFLMRIRFLDLERIWFHVSLVGVWLAYCSLDWFVCSYTGRKPKPPEYVLGASVVGILIANCVTEYFLAPPVILDTEKGISFIYEHFTAGTYLMYGILGLYSILLLGKIVRAIRKGSRYRSQLIPIAVGLLCCIIGNVLILFDTFKGIPLDLVGSLIFAVLAFFSLYRRHLFSMTLAFSKKTYLVATAGILVVIVSMAASPLEALIRSTDGPLASFSIAIVAIVTAFLGGVIFYAVRVFSDHIFLSEFHSRTSSLQEYQMQITDSLQVNSICDLYCREICKNLKCVDAVRVCILDEAGDYVTAGSSGILEVGTVMFRANHALPGWLSGVDHLVSEADFRGSLPARALWESEKQSLLSLKADYFMPLRDGNRLLGIVSFTLKDQKRTFRVEEADYLSNISMVTTAFIRNSQLYEKAAEEARADHLTGLLNRKYFIDSISRCFSENPTGLLSLVLVNLDDFKLYNQLYGQKAGDGTLIRIGQIIRQTAGEQNICGRYSGKEFGVLLKGQDTNAARRFAEAVRKEIHEVAPGGDINECAGTRLTCSIGICTIPFGAVNAKQLQDHTDMAVYQAKRNGKNDVVVYSAGSVSNPLTDRKLDHKKIYSGYASTIYAMAATIDAKDHYTFTHSNNVAYYASMLAEIYGLNPETVEIVREAALLHDIGKIGIPDQILNKPGKLTDEEYEIMKRHPENAVSIIRHLPNLDYVIPAVLGHHERYDGKGYPRRLSGEDIPLTARVLCVADCFDAITSKRCYQNSRDVEVAIRIISDNAGTQFDPKLAELFSENVRNGRIELQVSPSGEQIQQIV